MSDTQTYGIKLPDGRVLRHETPMQLHEGVLGTVGISVTVGERRFYVNDRPVQFWDYDFKTGAVEIIEFDEPEFIYIKPIESR